ncbi:MAG: PTS transporter subunit EIIB [Lacrimispora sp.]
MKFLTIAKKYNELAKQIITLVGEAESLAGLTHCITGLRFKLKDNAMPDKDTLKALDGVLSVVIGNGQFRIVVGMQQRIFIIRF